MYPVIGMIPSIDESKNVLYISMENVQAISKAGATPIIIPYLMNEEKMQQVIEGIDGLYLTGGYDIDPNFFNEEPHPKLGNVQRKRDDFEMKIVKHFLALNKPILGVCRGCQIINIALGGDIFQDIYTQIDEPLLQHQQRAIHSHASHFVHLEKKSLLYHLVGEHKIKVNSRHHQAIRNLGNTLSISGKASDGIIESIESTKYRFVVGVQWHPENMVSVQDEPSLNIFNGFIAACRNNHDLR